MVGSPEQLQLVDRLEVLAQSGGADFDGMVSIIMSRMVKSGMEGGMMIDVKQTSEVIAKVWPTVCEVPPLCFKAALVAPDAQRRQLVLSIGTFQWATTWMWHRVPGFDIELFAGPAGSKFRSQIETYDFDSMHTFFKSSLVGMDGFLYGHNTVGLVLFYGDLQSARAGWVKHIEAWKKIGTLIQSGERSWGEYFYEGLMSFLAPVQISKGFMCV